MKNQDNTQQELLKSVKKFINGFSLILFWVSMVVLVLIVGSVLMVVLAFIISLIGELDLIVLLGLIFIISFVLYFYARYKWGGVF